MFWDSSAVVPLLLPEPRSSLLSDLLARDQEPAAWWATPTECQSALYRHHRQRPLGSAAMHAALQRLETFVEDTDTVAATEGVRRRAARLLAIHPLRAGDALQLAAALVWCEETPDGEAFVCLDERLRAAAAKEGFDVLP
jgi:predicted nucleic acid-binding protein